MSQYSYLYDYQQALQHPNLLFRVNYQQPYKHDETNHHISENHGRSKK